MWALGYLSQSSSPWLWGVIAAVAAGAGTFGDLLESKLKRLANVKDSGSFMPGHGGFLDRFDSLLLATPFVWLLLKLIN
jgi:phosphatidate cytidylyltransferase